MKRLVKKNFHDFFTEQVTQYTNYQQQPLGIIGSVGFHFRDILTEVIDEYKMKITKMIKSPIEGLVDYHIATGI